MGATLLYHNTLENWGTPRNLSLTSRIVHCPAVYQPDFICTPAMGGLTSEAEEDQER
jgi:hypothetical protein